MIRVSVLGATGYAGAELVRLLAGHESVKIVHLGSKNYAGQNIDDLFRSLRALALPVLEAADESVADDSDVIFTSLPHGTSEEVIAALYQTGKRIIDLSGDFRYDDAAVYEKWYGLTHSCPDILAKSVYGLPELHREMIRPAQLIGNPGCYTTCSILALAPLAAHKLIDADTIIIDAKSGASGAGRGLTLQTHFNELDESVKAYGVGTHRHTSEIEQELSKLYGHAIQLSFTRICSLLSAAYSRQAMQS
jgi:N-acetyl-gamma-glutamyl-phosphate reductase